MSFLAGFLAGILALIVSAAVGSLVWFSRAVASIEAPDTVPVDWSES